MHKLSSFEDLNRSRLVAKSVRKMVFAVAQPASQNAEQEARGYVAPSDLTETPINQRQARAVRVVYPSRTVMR